jgi:hypothetical protein
VCSRPTPDGDQYEENTRILENPIHHRYRREAGTEPASRYRITRVNTGL